MVAEHVSLSLQKNRRVRLVQRFYKRTISARTLEGKTVRLTSIRRTTQQSLLLAREERQYDLLLERHVRALDGLGNSQKMRHARSIVVCTWSTPSTKAASGIVVCREDREGSSGGFARGIVADDVGCEAWKEGTKSTLCAGRFDLF